MVAFRILSKPPQFEPPEVCLYIYRDWFDFYCILLITKVIFVFNDLVIVSKKVFMMLHGHVA